MAKPSTQHVIPFEGKWAVKTEAEEEITAEFDSQEEAVEFAQEIAESEGTELIIHGEDGEVESKQNFEDDSEDPL